MQAGFAMLCAGSIRAKNCKNVLLWNLLDSCGGAIGFWSVGYAFAYGGDTPTGTTFIGNTNFFLVDGTDLHLWFFQFAFACALSSIVAGTVAERCKMQAYLCYSVFLCGFVYPVVAHAFWSTNGWLSNSNSNPFLGSGAIDLAGSGPVHMTGGVVALVMALIIGPRMGRFYAEDGTPLEEPRQFAGHNVTLQVGFHALNAIRGPKYILGYDKGSHSIFPFLILYIFLIYILQHTSSSSGLSAYGLAGMASTLGQLL